MTPKPRTTALLALFALTTIACSPKPAPPGYKGPLPSAAGQAAMKVLAGKTLKDASGNLWTINWFAVIPNDGSPKGVGPAVEIEHAGTKKHIPVESDGDAADLHKRVTGSAHPSLSGAPGRAYLDALSKLK